MIAEGFDEQIVALRFVVANRATLHHNLGIAVEGVLGVFLHGLVVASFLSSGLSQAEQARSSQGKTTTAIDVTEELSARHFNIGVATHAASSVVLVVVVSTTAEDVAVVARGAIGTQIAALIVHARVTQHVAVFSAAEDATPNAVVNGILGMTFCRHRNFNSNESVVHVGEIIKPSVRIIRFNRGIAHAPATAKHVAVLTIETTGDVVLLFSKCSHFRCRTHLAASDGHFGQTRVGLRYEVDDRRTWVSRDGMGIEMLAHAGHLTATIHVEEHMAATDVDFGVAFHQGRVAVNVITRAAAKHLTARSVDDAVQGCCRCGIVFASIFNCTHRAAKHVDLGVILHLAQLAATIHVAGNIGTIVEVDLRKHGRGNSVEGKRWVYFVIGYATAGTVHAATIPATLFLSVMLGGFHHIHIADGAIDFDLGKRILCGRNG